MNKVFRHVVQVTIGDTNLEETVYWLNYLKWFGQARELFMLEFMKPTIPEGVRPHEFFKAINVSIVTVKAQMEFRRPVYFGDLVEVRIQVSDFHESRVTVICNIVNQKTGELVATGNQVLAFANLAGKIIRMPDVIRDLAKEYEVES